VVNWAPYYIRRDAGGARRHVARRGNTWWGVKEGAIDLVSLAPDVPAELRARVESGRPA
jgi:simple sugar transport system substrate-binding protein